MLMLRCFVFLISVLSRVLEEMRPDSNGMWAERQECQQLCKCVQVVGSMFFRIIHAAGEAGT